METDNPEVLAERVMRVYNVPAFGPHIHHYYMMERKDEYYEILGKMSRVGINSVDIMVTGSHGKRNSDRIDGGTGRNDTYEANSRPGVV